MLKVVFQNCFDTEEDDLVVNSQSPIDTIMAYHSDGLPDNTRLYHNQVSMATDVTPSEVNIEADIERLNSLEGTLYVVTHPGFAGFGILGSLLQVFILGLISYLLRPKPPVERNKGEQSPNNGLSDRTNSARVAERIPDIFGAVRSVPDLIAKSYFIFEDHREVEYSYMCVGTGSFEISDVKDDITPIEDISGVSYAVYGPDASPNGGVAQATYGTPITERVWAARKSNAVNGQTLRAPNASVVTGANDIAFDSPDTISSNNNDIDFEEYFAPGDNLTISNAVSGANTINLGGVYEILSVTNNSITLVNPGTVNALWNDNFNTGFSSARLATSTQKWVGPFVIEGAHKVLVNFIAQNGLYQENQEDQFTLGVDIHVECRPILANGNVGFPAFVRVFRIKGSAELQNSRAVSGFFTLPDQTIAESQVNKWQVRCRRITDSPSGTDLRVVDEIQWRDLYSMKYVTEDHFGDVTTVHVKTPATQGALSVKQRKFNCLAKRLIDDGTGTGTLAPSSNADLILKAIALDPKLGAMSAAELDTAQITSAVNDVNAYFGTSFARNFNHTFDQKNTSAEEMIQAVAASIHCTAYRQGQLLKLHFEKQTDLAVLQFNHRNKIPGTELRSIQFGTSQDNDGIDLDWTDTEDGAVQTFQVPTDGSAVNPKKLEIPGLTSEIQAHFHAWREYQKLTHRNVAVDFDATAEAITLTLNQRILVADNTRGDTWDGYIKFQDGVDLYLSQPFEGVDGTIYTIHLQHPDGDVEALDLVAFGENSVTVGTAPRLPIDYDPGRYANTTYIIVEKSRKRPTAFLVQEITPKDSMQVSLGAVNYSDEYYIKDKDVVSNAATIDSEGNVTVQEIGMVTNPIVSSSGNVYGNVYGNVNGGVYSYV